MTFLYYFSLFNDDMPILISFFLSDSCCLPDYDITDGAKLHLFVKKSSEVSELKSKCSKTDFWLNLRTLLKNHFSDADVEKVLQKSKEVCKGSVKGAPYNM